MPDHHVDDLIKQLLTAHSHYVHASTQATYTGPTPTNWGATIERLRDATLNLETAKQALRDATQGGCT